MSQARNKVDWCLKKAAQELAQGTRHRGLIRQQPDPEEARKHLAKAEHNYKALIAFERTGFPDWSVSAAFYAIYHSFLAIIVKHGYASRNQECTIALIKYLCEQGTIAIDHDLIEQLENNDEDRHESNTIQLRENFQYGIQTIIEDHQLETLKELCKKAIDQAKSVIYNY